MMMKREQLRRFVSYWDKLLQAVPEARKEAVEAAGEAVSRSLDAQIQSADIMSAVEHRLNSTFLGKPVYWDRLPKDFKRPCFTVECQKADETDASVFLVQKQVELLIICWVEADAYGDSSREELTRRQRRVMGLFSAGSFPVEDCHLAVLANRGEQTPEVATVTAAFSWMDVRPSLIDPDDPSDPEGAKVPRMENFEISRT